ncbi:MAG: hypothetical protein ABFC57_04320 [Veillonellales bacterium]
MRKYGINPKLIAVMAGVDMSELPSNPTATHLPGKYAKLVAKNMDKIPPSEIKNSYRLKCGHCGKTGEYNLGTVAFDPARIANARNSDKSRILDCIQVPAYFRCKHCNGAGKWELAGNPAMLEMGLMAAMLLNTCIDSDSSDRFMVGTILVDGDFRLHWGTDAEEHFLAKLGKDPEDAYRWNRLGNYFYKNG